MRGILAAFLLLLGDYALSGQQHQAPTHVPFSDRDSLLIVDGVSFRVDPQAWFAFQGPWTESRFRILLRALLQLDREHGADCANVSAGAIDPRRTLTAACTRM